MSDKTSRDEEHLGRRTLAAIMFTDVVGFSRRTGENEDATLRMTARDLKIIADFVKQHEGRVIKSTGDGCLAFFPSGVQAVSCAQEIQHHFAELAQTLPSKDLLQHRIGIHLGDVYVKGNEVMGDGVNIAARLEAQAPPGGICISQALYEIAKSRLRLQTVHLGAKHLKNIAESVQVYQVLIDADDAAPAATRRAGKGVAGLLKKHWLVSVAAVVVIAVAAALIVNAMSTNDGKDLATPVATPDADESDADDENDDTDVPDTTLVARTVPVDAMGKAALAEYPKVKAMHLRTRDYAGLVAWIERSHLRDSDVAGDLKKYGNLARLFKWAGDGLAGYRKHAPLEINSAVGGRMSVWTDPNGQLMLRTAAGAEQRTSLTKSPEAGYVLLVLATLARERWGDKGAPKGTENGRLLDAMFVFAKDNKLDADKLLSPLRAGDRRPAAAELFRRFDSDRDGKLTREETPDILRRRFTLLDANRDGFLSLDELRAGRTRRPRRRP